MPVPEERLHKPDKLNRWFAVSSILMTVSIVWMIWVDYDRPWRAYQDHYYLDRAAFAHFELLDTQTEAQTKALAIAEAELKAQLELDAATKAATRAKLHEELAHADLEFKKADAPFGRLVQVLQVLRDDYERALGAHGPDHPQTQAADRKVRDTFAESEDLRKQKEHFEDELRRVRGELKLLDKDLQAAQRKVKDLTDVADAARQKDLQFRGVLADKGLLAGIPIVKGLINLPLLDFTAPKNTPSRHQVNQLVLPDVRQRLNYLESYTTDRCTTCHVAIDDPAFTPENLTRRLEQALPAINEALVREKKPALSIPTPPLLAGDGVKIPAGQVAEHWHELSKKQQGEYFEALVSTVNQYLKSTGRKTIELKQPLLAHPEIDLYVSIDSPHPMNKVGCTVCHEGNPQETDFIFAAHSPPTHKIEERWKDEYYISILGVPNMTFETMAHFWDRPMRWPQYTEAGCAKCHTDIADIDRFRGDRKGEKINEGRYLFANLGCVNCHVVDTLAGSRRVGPELTQIASKLTPEFTQQWVYFPQKFRPSTLMPHFFEQENNRAEGKNELDPHPQLRTETEVAAITKYLFAVSQPWKPATKPKEVQGDAERGRGLFKSVGCLACHSNLAEFGESWIVKDIAAREKLDEVKAKARYEGMTLEQRSLYAREHFVSDVDTWLAPEKAAFTPGGSEPPPTFSRVAPDLSGIGSKVQFEWLYSWLLEPKHYFAETKMPSLRLSPGEAADLAAYLLTLTNEEFKPAEFAMTAERVTMADGLILSILATQRSERQSKAILDDQGGELSKMLAALLEGALGKQPAYDLVSDKSLLDKKLMFLGHKMITHYGCYACHTITGFKDATAPGTELSGWAEKPISQLDFAFYNHAFHDMRHANPKTYDHVYPLDADELNKWSPGENPEEQITHTHAAFAKHKLLNPRIWDREKIKGPYDKLKMPNFYLNEKQADALTTYLLSRIPPRVSDALKADYEGDVDGPIARGRHLVRELNCIGCHEIEDNVPTIQQYYRRPIGGKLTFDSLNAPPSLRGEGAKVNHAWFHQFLLGVEPLRPWLQVRMPSFNISNEDATTLVEYFAALSRDESDALASALAPVEEYKKSAAKKGASADAGSDWFGDLSLQPSAEALARFGLERSLIRTRDVDRLRSSPEDVRAGHAKLLERTKFIRDLYDVDYPFVEPARPPLESDRFEKGFEFLNAMGCLKCHVLGNMLPGPAENTDQFVQTYRLDGVQGEGAQAVAILNGRSYAIGAEIDGHKLISATNIVYETGDSETKAVLEGPKADGEGTEKILLQAASAPNLSLTHRRLRREWVEEWMKQPALIQPGTKMPQNFDFSKPDAYAFAKDERFPGTMEEHLQLIVDFLYDAGFKGTRAPLPKLKAAEPKGFDDEAKEFEDDE